MVGEEALTSDSEKEEDEGRQRLEPDQEGVLRLEGGSSEDDLDLLNGLFHWQMEDYELFLSCNMLRVDEGKKEEGNECPKEHREAEEGKVLTAEVEGKNTQYERRRRKDSTVRPRRKKMLRRTTDIAERCRQQGRQIIWYAQETKMKGLIKVAAVRSGGVIDGKKGQLTESMVPSFGNKLGDMENRMERSCTLNKLDERRLQSQWATKVIQNRRNAWHDKHLKLNRFQSGQWVLKYDGRNEIKSGKLSVKWVGPYKILEVGDNGAMKLWMLDGKEVADAVNRLKLNVYHDNVPPWTNN